MNEFLRLDRIISLRNAKFMRMSLAYGVNLMLIMLLVPSAPALLVPALIAFCLTLLFMDQKGVIVGLYVISIATNGYVLKDHYLFDALGPIQVYGVFAIYVLGIIKVKTPVQKFAKVALHIVWIVLLYQTYYGFKNAFFGLQEQTYRTAILRGMNAVIMYVPLLMLIAKSSNHRVQSWLVSGLWLGCFNMVFFCLISPALPELGFYSQGVQTAGIEGLESNSRHDGVMGNGDSNSLGVLFTMAIGFFISRPESLSRSSLIKGLIALMIVGVALTGSRTAFVALTFVIGAYFFSKGQGKLKLKAMFFGLIFIALTEPLWETVLLRMADADSQLDTSTSSNRVGKWILYMTYILEQPITLLIGTPRTLLIGRRDTFHQAHNVFITMLYNGGLVFVIALFWKFVEIVRAILKRSTLHSLLYVFVPFFAIVMFVSDMGIFVYFSAFLSLYLTKREAKTTIISA